MDLKQIRLGKTYFGKPDFKRGIGSLRTVFNIDSIVISFRNEVGLNPPRSYVELASMAAEEFAAWAEKEVPTPPRAKSSSV